MAADRNDPEIRSVIAASCAETFSDLAAAIAARFGNDRAWPVALVAEVRRELVPPRAAKRSRFLADVEVMAFIADRADLISLDRLLAAGIETFGRGRFPSRAHLGRMVKKSRHSAP